MEVIKCNKSFSFSERIDICREKINKAKNGVLTPEERKERIKESKRRYKYRNYSPEKVERLLSKEKKKVVDIKPVNIPR